MSISYDSRWDYILDTSKTLIEAIPIIGDTGTTNINLVANPPYEIIANNTIPTTLQFLDLVDTKTSYSLLTTDYMVQVSSVTYQTIYLPKALGLGAYTYYISNNSTQTIAVWAQAGDIIDNKQLIRLDAQQHALFTSNSYNKWYMD
jgi:hypothetical protein